METEEKLREFNKLEQTSVVENKGWRLRLDRMLQEIKSSERSSRERSIFITKLQEAIMWAGMDLKALNDGRTIYPDSYDPSNTYVAPHADGLKM
jgi:hypothetical protein